jgi:hypothetical protein
MLLRVFVVHRIRVWEYSRTDNQQPMQVRDSDLIVFSDLPSWARMKTHGNMNLFPIIKKKART